MPDAPLSDSSLAESIARTAANVLLATRAGFDGDDLRALKDAGDASAQAHIAARLAVEAPGDAVLSEEAKDSPVRLSADRVWIIDPLDGTREFSEGRDDWAVHVALWQGGELTVGAVALGGPDTVLSSATVAAPPARPAGPIRIAVSRSRPPAITTAVAESLGATVVPMGSAGVKVCAVVTGEVDAYVHGGGQYEWDSAAPIAVARAAGLFTSRLDGSPLRYNQENPYLPDLIVCRPEFATQILEAVATAERKASE